MRIVVILGRVLDPDGVVVNRRRGRVFVNRETYILQPADAGGLEAALRIKDAGDDGEIEVVALPRGPLPDDDVLRQALVLGADRAICPEGFEDADGVDDAAMVGVLAAAVARLGDVDLVLTGSTTLDTDQGQLGPRLAEALGWPQIGGAWQVTIADGKVRAILSGVPEAVTVGADLPALVTVLPGALKRRYPDGVRLINVYRDVGAIAEALERWDVNELVDEAALQPLVEGRGRDFPPERELGARVDGTLLEQAQVVADALRRHRSRQMRRA
ncbi:MAG TPA: hypothetical protein ENN19_07980 [Chloroflexi bacterium]|nr:hypothetical protein [Chloroflexota bacterium]